MKVTIGCDHAGFELKEKIKIFLKNRNEGIEVEDKGTFSLDSVDYPDFAHKVAETVEQKLSERGILVCGSGVGVSIAANRHKGVRAALCWIPEIASLARQHNDANIVCIPARFTTEEMAIEIVNTFLSTEFEGGRHQKRVDKINI